MENQWVKVLNVPWTHKFIELEAFDTEEDPTIEGKRRIRSWSIELRQKTQIDHAGFEIEIDFPFRTWILHFYDHRHWNYENEEWVKYD